MATKQKMDLLTAVEHIVDKAKGTGLSPEFYRKAARYIKYVADKMELTREQAVMMALFIDNSDDTSITMRDMGRFLECRTTRILKYMSTIDELEKKELVRCNRGSHQFSYRVPIEVLEAFKINEKFEPKECTGLSCMELFGELEDIFELRNENELTYENMVEKINHLFECNKQLLYVQKVLSYGLEGDDKMLLILFSHLFVNNTDDNIRFHDLDFLYEKWLWNRVKSQLNRGDHVLMANNIIEYNNSDGFVDRESFRMSDTAKRELFVELNLASLNQKSKRNDVVKCEDITPNPSLTV